MKFTQTVFSEFAVLPVPRYRHGRDARVTTCVLMPESAEPLKTSPHFDPRPDRKPGIRALKAFNRVLCRCYHHLTVLAPPQIPDTGAAILISNHTSGLDPFLLQSACKRVIVWKMAKEYYELRAFRRMFKMLEAIPVDRAARDTGALRSALRALQEGRVLGVFPEGRISTQRPQILPFQPGVAQMAIKTGAPVCPAFLDGTQYGLSDMTPAFLRRQIATVRFGPAVQLDRTSSSRDALHAATSQLHDAVERLKT